MARILGDESDKAPGAAPKANALTVGGVRFTHAAARFWASLLGEVATDYPDCTALVFETLSGTVLTRSLLFPETALQRELDRLQPNFRIEQALQEALAEFELYGPPGAVQIRLLARARPPAALEAQRLRAGNATPGIDGDDEREIKRCNLPLDCVDADIFAYLLAWLMEWAEIQENQWNSDRVEGAFLIHDPDRTATSRLQFEFTRRHLCEGLYHWRVLIRQAHPA